MMPTAARLVAAISLGLVGILASELIKPYPPEGTDFGWFSAVNFAIGVFVGWRWLGTQVGKGRSIAITNGITSAILLTAIGLLVQGANEALRRALMSLYSEPLEALRAILEIAGNYGLYLLHPEIIAALIGGGIVSSFLTEAAARRWR